MHDATGNVDTATDARGTTADYSYDAAGRLTDIVYADRTLQHSYDQGTYGAGRLMGEQPRVYRSILRVSRAAIA